MANKVPIIDYDKEDFNYNIMNKESYNLESFDKQLDNALKIYNIDKKYLKSDYNNKHSKLNIQYEISELLHLMLKKYQDNFFHDGRGKESKSNTKSMSEINYYNNSLLYEFKNSQKLPDYVKLLLVNNNTYRYNKNLETLSNFLIEQLSILFYLIFNTDCTVTEKGIIDLIERIVIWNDGIIKEYYEKDLLRDACQNKETDNEEVESSEIIHITGVEDTFENNKHGLDENITMAFNALIRKDVNKSNLYLPDELIDMMIESNGILKELAPDKSVNEKIHKIFSSDDGNQESLLRKEYKAILDNFIKDKIEKVNTCNLKQKEENNLISTNIELIKFITNNSLNKHDEAVIIDLIDGELKRFVEWKKDKNNRIPFYHHSWRIIVDKMDLTKYYSELNVFIDDCDYLNRWVSDQIPVIPKEYLLNEEKKNEYMKLYQVKADEKFAELDSMINSMAKEIYNEMVSEVIPNLSLNKAKDSVITDKDVYSKIKKDLDLFLGQIYLQVLKSENIDYLKSKEEIKKNKNKGKELI